MWLVKENTNQGMLFFVEHMPGRKDKLISIADWNKKFEPNAKQQ